MKDLSSKMVVAARVLLVAVLAALTVLGVREWMRASSARDSAPIMGTVPDFSFTEKSGRQVGMADLRGKVWVVDFVFTHCAGPCPLMSQRMSELQSEVAALPDVRLVSVSVDPERDTPAVLGEYAKRYGATDRWLFLTGENAKLRKWIIEGFKLGVADNPAWSPPADEGQILHSTSFVLVDRSGRIRGYFDSSKDVSRSNLMLQIKRLLRERVES